MCAAHPGIYNCLAANGEGPSKYSPAADWCGRTAMDFTTLNYELAAPRQIVFGWDAAAKWAAWLDRSAARLLVSGSPARPPKG